MILERICKDRTICTDKTKAGFAFYPLPSHVEFSRAHDSDSTTVSAEANVRSICLLLRQALRDSEKC